MFHYLLPVSIILTLDDSISNLPGTLPCSVSHLASILSRVSTRLTVGLPATGDSVLSCFAPVVERSAGPLEGPIFPVSTENLVIYNLRRGNLPCVKSWSRASSCVERSLTAPKGDIILEADALSTFSLVRTRLRGGSWLLVLILPGHMSAQVVRVVCVRTGLRTAMGFMGVSRLLCGLESPGTMRRRLYLPRKVWLGPLGGRIESESGSECAGARQERAHTRDFLAGL